MIEEKRQGFYFWLREYMRRGGNGLLADEADGTLTSTEILQKLQKGESLQFSCSLLNPRIPDYMRRAVMPFIWHRDTRDRVANKILEPIAKVEFGEKRCPPKFGQVC